MEVKRTSVSQCGRNSVRVPRILWLALPIILILTLAGSAQEKTSNSSASADSKGAITGTISNDKNEGVSGAVITVSGGGRFSQQSCTPGGAGMSQQIS